MRLKPLVIAAMAAATLALAACGADAPASPDSSADPSADGGGGGDGDRDECLIGTWQVDMDHFAEGFIGLLQMPGLTAESSGSITLAFGDEMTATYDNTLVATMPVGGGTNMEITAVYSGSAASTDWTATDGVIRGTMPQNDVTIDMSAMVGGQTVEMPSQQMGSGTLDPGVDGVDYSCDGDSLTLNPPAPAPDWKLARA